jgi:hypothetical protein
MTAANEGPSNCSKSVYFIQNIYGDHVNKREAGGRKSLKRSSQRDDCSACVLIFMRFSIPLL